jgi:glycine/D-amino acid oxidase-like deaminating enzyme
MATTGFTLSPLMARLLAESMATGRTTLPPTYDVDRAGGHPIPT